MSEELSLIRFNVINFFSLILNSRPFSPISTILIKIVEALISSEPTPDKKHQERIKFIYDNTHKKLNTPLPTIELLVFRNLDKGINKEIDIGDKTFYLFELYNILDEIAKDLTQIVIEIAKKYAVDFPISLTGVQQAVKINLEEGK